MNDDMRLIKEHQDALDDLTGYINSGEVKCIMFQLLLDNGESVNYWTSGISLIEMLGLLESMKYDVLEKAEKKVDLTQDDDEGEP